MALGDILRSFAAPDGVPVDLTYDGRALWHVDQFTGQIYELSPQDGTVHRSFATGLQLAGIAFDGAHLWTAELADASLIRLFDPQTGVILRSYPAPAVNSRGLAYDGRALWLVDNGTNLIYKLDPRNGTVLLSFATPGATGIGIVPDGAFLWHTDFGTNLIYKLDPRNGTVLLSFATPSTEPRGLAFDGRSLFHVDSLTDLIYQLKLE